MIRAVIFDYDGVVAGKVTDFYVTDSSGKKSPGDPSIEKVTRRLGVGYTTLFEYIEKDIHRLQRGVLHEEKMWERSRRYRFWCVFSFQLRTFFYQRCWTSSRHSCNDASLSVRIKKKTPRNLFHQEKLNEVKFFLIV